MLRTRKYQESFLTKPRRGLTVRGHEKAERCVRIVQDPAEGSDVYPVSWLGLINGVLYKLRVPRKFACDVAITTDGDRYITGWKLLA